MRPDEEGHAEPGHARRAQRMDGDDEIEAGQDRRETGDEDADHHGRDMGVREAAAIGRVERPAGIGAADDHAVKGEETGEDKNIEAEEVQPRKGEILGADHQRNEKIAECVGNRRNKKKPDHHDAMHREQLVVIVIGEYLAAGNDEREADQRRCGAADKEEAGDGAKEKQSDALMVGGEEPRRDRRAVMEIVLCRSFGDRNIVAGRVDGHGVPPLWPRLSI